MKSQFFLENIPQRPYRILTIGDLAGMVSKNHSDSIHITSESKMLDAISIANDKSFDLIAIAFNKFKGNLGPALQNLRNTKPQAKIVLLAQIHEEPEVMKFISSAENSSIDDYIITPVEFVLSSPASTEPDEQKNALLDKITAQQKQIEILEKLATQDDLTGIKNRRYFMEFLRQIITRAKNEDHQVTLLTFDIDNFKKYNDTHGHQVGDSILKQVTILMQKCCRSQDVVARIGGDEFAVAFWSLPAEKVISLESERRNVDNRHPSEAIMISERFRNELNKTDLPALGAYGQGVLAISGGLATYPNDGTTVSELFAKADQALMEAKRNGKNQVYLVGDKHQHSIP